MSATALHLAAFDGDTDTVNRLLSEGAGVNERTGEGETPLLFAAMNGHTDAIRVLLKHGADANALPGEGHSPVRRAINGGHAETVRVLLERGADADIEPREKPVTPEDTAKMREQFAEMHEKMGQMMSAFGVAESAPPFLNDESLFASKPEPPKPSGYGKSRAVMNAIVAGSLPTLQALLEAGFPAEPPPGLPKIPAPLEMCRNFPNGLEAARLLLKHGANPDGNAQENGMSPLQTAVAFGDLPFAQLLMEAGANTTVGGVGMSLMSLALMRENEELVAFLAERGIGLDDEMVGIHAKNYERPDLLRIIEEKRGTAWLASVKTGDAEAVRAALEAGVSDINIRNGDKESAPEIAVKNGDVAMVSLLLDAGADANAANDYGTTPLHDAAGINAGAIIALLVGRGANVSSENRWGQTPLLRAAMGSHNEAADALLAAGATLGVVEAILLERSDAIADFWSRGTPVTYANEAGLTPLHAAIQRGDFTLAAWLLECGANIEAATRFDSTPLESAVVSDNVDAVRFLLDAGANPNGANNKGGFHSPLKSAAISWNEPVVRLLLERGATLTQSLDAATVKLVTENGKPEHGQKRDDMLAEMTRTAQLLNTVLQTHRYSTENPLAELPENWRDTTRLWATVRTLMEFGADASSYNGGYDTPLSDLVALDAPTDLVRFALEKGASANPTGTMAEAPLMTATKKNRADVVEVLLANGANPNGGMTAESPLQVARENGYQAIVTLLQDHGASDEKRQAIIAGFGDDAKIWFRASTKQDSAPASKSPMANLPTLDFGVITQKRETVRQKRVADRREQLMREIAEAR